MLEHFFACPHCWEEVSVLLDPSIPAQEYIEDCEVCCNPISFTVHFEDQELQNFEVQEIGQ